MRKEYLKPEITLIRFQPQESITATAGSGLEEDELPPIPIP